MLLQFSVENFKSFNGPTVFSMRASRLKGHPNHVISGDVPTLRGAAIYGPNASGKSNLILAMAFARDLIVRGTPMGRGIAVQPHALRADGSRVSKFKWHFAHAGKIWSYGFAVEARRVVEEYLYVRDAKGKERKWFERTHEGDKVEVTFGPDLRGPAKGELAQRLNLIRKNIAKRGEQLFLTFALENSVEELQPVGEWFEKVLVIVRAETKFVPLMHAVESDKNFLQFLSDFLRFADTGINCLVPEQEPFKLESLLPPNAPVEMRADYEASIAELEKDDTLIVSVEGPDTDVVPVGIKRDGDGKLWLLRLKARHINENGESVDFPLEWESEGTQRLIHLVPALYGHRNQPMVLVVDELDRRLHTLLTRKFVELAFNGSQQAGNQLIFTTHDTNLLDNDLLRRDEIWMVQKEGGATQLTSLAEYDIRSDLNYEDAYLKGEFEAIPRLLGERRLLTVGGDD